MTESVTRETVESTNKWSSTKEGRRIFYWTLYDLWSIKRGDKVTRGRSRVRAEEAAGAVWGELGGGRSARGSARVAALHEQAARARARARVLRRITLRRDL